MRISVLVRCKTEVGGGVGIGISRPNGISRQAAANRAHAVTKRKVRKRPSTQSPQRAEHRNALSISNTTGFFAGFHPSAYSTLHPRSRLAGSAIRRGVPHELLRLRHEAG